mmetsp:Transcript_37617/g.87972  ORF Transcript_37617/g.87972 Transcript_37617/m.87972 type:complete len:239 (+) Transcript_37617:1912-2628(+)
MQARIVSGASEQLLPQKRELGDPLAARPPLLRRVAVWIRRVDRLDLAAGLFVEPRIETTTPVHLAKGDPQVPPALVAENPLWVEREGKALVDALHQKAAQLTLIQIAKLDPVELVPRDKVLRVEGLREVVVEALGAMAHRPDDARPRHRLRHDEAGGGVAVAERAGHWWRVILVLFDLQSIDPALHPRRDLLVELALAGRAPQQLFDVVELPANQLGLLVWQRLVRLVACAHKKAVEV